MALGPRTGLPIPRVQDAELQRFLEYTRRRLIEIPGEAAAAADRVARTIRATPGLPTGEPPGGYPTTPTTPTDTDDTTGTQIPTLAVPPRPEGLNVACGIEVCMLSWASPFRTYANHAHTVIYRAASDQFDQAVEIGQAVWLLYVDDTVMGNQTYWYWIRYVSTSGVEGPLSEGVSGRAARSPEELHQEIIDWLESSPLLEALTSDSFQGPVATPSTPVAALEEIRRISGIFALLTSTAGDYNIRQIEANRTAITALRDTPTGFIPGMAPNTFRGDALAEAETARDAYSDDAANAAWLADYDANGHHYILLEYYT